MRKYANAVYPFSYTWPNFKIKLWRVAETDSLKIFLLFSLSAPFSRFLFCWAFDTSGMLGLRDIDSRKSLQK